MFQPRGLDIPHTSLCVSEVCKKMKLFFKNNFKASHVKHQHYHRVLLISLVANFFQCSKWFQSLQFDTVTLEGSGIPTDSSVSLFSLQPQSRLIEETC